MWRKQRKGRGILASLGRQVKGDSTATTGAAASTRANARGFGRCTSSSGLHHAGSGGRLGTVQPNARHPGNQCRLTASQAAPTFGWTLNGAAFFCVPTIYGKAQMNDRRRVSIDIDLPVINERDRHQAEKIATAPVALETADGPVSMRPSEVKDDDIRREAFRIASIADKSEREQAIYDSLASCMELVRDSQMVAARFVVVARELDTAASQLEAVEDIAVDGIRRSDSSE